MIICCCYFFWMNIPMQDTTEALQNNTVFDRFRDLKEAAITILYNRIKCLALKVKKAIKDSEVKPTIPKV